MLAHIDSGQLKSLVAYWLTIKEPRLRHAHAERFSKSGVGVSLRQLAAIENLRQIFVPKHFPMSPAASQLG
jgi:hypothetical protein